MSNSKEIPSAANTAKVREPRATRRALHHVTAALALLSCFLGVWIAARFGISRLLSEYASSASVLVVADEAVRLSPRDFQAHFSRALVLSDQERHDEAAKEFERAIALRPADYFLWLELGRSREEISDNEGALAAYKEAVTLAPHYAQPHWQLGNLLLRAGEDTEAFAELRLAAVSDPKLFPAVADLAWSAYGGDAGKVLSATQPQTSTARLALAIFFAAHDEAVETVELFRAASADVSEQDRRALINELIRATNFQQAYEVWSNKSFDRANGQSISDGGFEAGILVDEPGFGWKPTTAETVRLALDTNLPRSGARSLRLEFIGDPYPAFPAVTQITLVQPNTRYRLTFAARTESLVTGGLPFIAVADAAGDKRILASSSTLPAGTSAWQDYTMEFTTGVTSRAVLISIQRQFCTSEPCPAFGRAWFDNIALEKLGT